MYDIAVVGGGPAGLSAAVQARARGRSVVVIGGDARDNALYKTKRIDNYLGFYGVTGPELLERFEAHAREMGVERRDGRVLSIMPLENEFYLAVGSEVEQARAVVLATGVVQAGKFPGEAEHLGAGVSYCATCDGMLYRKREVVVVGRAADAPHEANYLKEIGCKVTYVSPKPPEGLRPDIPFVKAGKIQVLGDKAVEAVQADGGTIPCEGVFILRPSMAPTELLPGLELEGTISGWTGTWPPASPACSPRGTAPGCPSRSPKPWARARWRATGRRNMWIP